MKVSEEDDYVGPLRLLAEHAPPARPLNVPGHRGTTFSIASTWLLYNVGDTAVMMPISKGAPSQKAADEGLTFQFREFIVCHDLRAADRSAGRNADLTALVALASGDVMRWKPLTRKTTAPYTPGTAWLH